MQAKPCVVARRQTWLRLTAMSLLLAVLSALCAASPVSATWLIAVIGAATALVIVVGHFPPAVRLMASRILLAATFIGGLLVLLEAIGALEAVGLAASGRPSLWFQDANTLGATIAVLTVGSLLLASQSWQRLSLILTGAPAIALSGSRAAVAATVAGVAMAALAGRSARTRRASMLLMLGAIALTVGVMPLFGTDRNLLRIGGRFERWSTGYSGYSAQVVVDPNVAPGPVVGSMATRLVGRSRAPQSLVIYAHGGYATPGVPYIASVYLRSKTPQVVVLDSNLGAATCHVSGEWSRCVTPAVVASDKRPVQLRLESVRPGEGFDLLAWGPQVEVGQNAGPVQRNLSLGRIAERFRVVDGDFTTDLRRRWQKFVIAWDAFLSSPLGGVGHGQLARLYEEELGFRTHAHNAALQLLAESGVLGLLAYAVMFIGFGVVGTRVGGWRVAMFIVVMLAMNMFDATHFSRWVFYPYWMTFALLVHSGCDREHANQKPPSSVNTHRHTARYLDSAHLTGPTEYST